MNNTLTNTEKKFSQSKLKEQDDQPEGPIQEA